MRICFLFPRFTYPAGSVLLSLIELSQKHSKTQINSISFLGPIHREWISQWAGLLCLCMFHTLYPNIVRLITDWVKVQLRFPLGRHALPFTHVHIRAGHGPRRKRDELI